MCDLSNLASWNRFCEAATSEKTWMHERLSWLFTPQGILFAAYVLTLQDSRFTTNANKDIASALSKIIPIAGLLISIIVLIGVAAAGIMHWKWTSRLNELAKKLNTSDNAIVPFGTEPHWPARSSSLLPSVLALVFVVAWGSVLFWL